MNENSQITLRSVGPDDIGSCLILSTAEGWNQTEKDWQRLMGNPLNICLVAESDHRIIGTATAMNYSNEIAWIGMMLVDNRHRGKGISKMLLNDLIDRLNSCRSVKLDATPAGHPVYEKFGFKNEYIIHRMTSPSLNNFKPGNSGITPVPILISDIQEVIVLDSSIFGAERTFLIKSLIEDYPANGWCIKREGRMTSFALGRQGRKYQQIGQVFASDLEEAIVLISHNLLKRIGQPIVLDVPADKKELISWLTSISFSIQRDFVRMYLKSNPCPGITEKQFLICGPEFG